MKTLLLLPMTLFVFYTGFLSILVFRTRVRAIRAGQVEAKYFKVYSGAHPPERAIVVGRHYDNQFQVPVLFLIASTLHLMQGNPDFLTVSLAWLFLVSRAAHAWVHLGRNNLRQRVATFALGWLFLLVLWAQLLLRAWI